MDEWVIDGRPFRLNIERKPIKHAYLRVKHNNTIHVTCGRHFKRQDIFSFIKHNEAKILKAADKKRLPPYDGRWTIFGHDHHHEVVPGQKPWIEHRGSKVWTREDVCPEHAIEAFYGRMVRRETASFLHDHPIRRHFDLSGVTWKTQRMSSRFGSCHPGKQTIKLNTCLGRFDREYLHATVLHEIVHLKVNNHGKKFYDWLLSYMPDYKIVHRELRRLFNTYEVR